MPARLDEDDRTQSTVTDNLGRNQETTIINESGLYSVILRSYKPEAKQFKRWVTHEILPQIRKTGSYSIAPKSLKEALYLAYKQQEKIEFLEKSKAWINDKKTATAMATASIKSRECTKFKTEAENLKVELDLSKQFATVKFCETKTKKKFDWRKLRNYCNMNELEMRKVFDTNYGELNSYPAKAWLSVYGIKL